MATRLQLRRGSTTENNNFTGAEAELTYDKTTKGLRIHDGSKQGGYMVDTVVAFQAPTAENNYSWYRKYASGWVEQGGSLGVGNNPVSLPVKMKDINYTITLALLNSENNNNTFGYRIYQITNTNFTVRTVYNGTQYNYIFCWEVKGMAA